MNTVEKVSNHIVDVPTRELGRRIVEEALEMREALLWIASMKGKTLISMEHGQPYSLGANAAFEQCADIAAAVLTDQATLAERERK